MYNLKAFVFSCIFFGTFLKISLGTVSLTHLSTTYMPVRYTPTAEYEYNKEAAEQLAYDPSQKHVYSVGVNLLHVIDVNDPSNQKIAYYTSNSVGNITDVEVCGQFVAIAIDNYLNPQNGMVYIYRLYNPSTQQLEKVNEITVGALPDMLKFTHDCRKIIVAIEGEVRMYNGQVIDPEGGVGIVEFDSTDLGGNYQLRVADFKSFNPRADEYIAKGVRWIWRGEGAGISNTFSQDLEPEYIALNKDDTKAYVVLQENNAMAVVDIASATVEEIYALGWKPWMNSGFDASDRDLAINIQPWGVYGMYQPDSIKYLTIQGTDYILTANEGDSRSFEAPNYNFEWDESKRGKKFGNEGLIDDSVDQGLKDQLADNNMLGRLKFTNTTGKNAQGKFTSFYAYGGRGVSIFNPTDLSLVWDSGNRFEKAMQTNLPDIFNSNGKDASLTPEGSRDSRSDNSGPEAESLAVGEINGVTYVFAGIERPGVVVIYSVPSSGPVDLVYEGINYAGGLGRPFEELWQDRVGRDLDPEDIRFIPASESPNNNPLLLIAGSVSGTVSLYSIQVTAESTKTDWNNMVQVGKHVSHDKSASAATVQPVAIAAICLSVVAVVISGMVLVIKLRRKRTDITSESTMNLPEHVVIQHA